jgi:hypothetical protein
LLELLEHSPRWRTVELLGQTNELNAEGLEVLQSPQQVKNRTRKPIEPPEVTSTKSRSSSGRFSFVPEFPKST